MKDIKNYDYEKLVKLNDEILTSDEMDMLFNHELVKYCECLGVSGLHTDCYWFDVEICVEYECKTRINIYCKYDEMGCI